MTLNPGTMLAHYRVEDIIGKGGMGEVYRAQDTKLGRDVALKILPPEFAADPDRVARFQREAKLLASLHHPNIASIFGFEKTDSCTFLVMELVDGEDLADVLRRGALPVDEAVDVARQIAEGLEEAHEKGIVHRDLKPANVKRTTDGKVKILDFGLARALAGHTAVEEEVSSAPTMTAAMTQVGAVIGTAAYMSPEQARGKEVDRRADIWAFGVILFEMLTGGQLFTGETASDTLAGILKSEPEWDSLPDGVPFQVERVLRRCLAKNPRQRLRDIGEARVRLDDPAAESGLFTGEMAAAPEPGRGLESMLPWVLLAVALALGAFGWLGRPTTPAPEFRQYDLQLQVSTNNDDLVQPVVSPDGEWVAASLPDSLGGYRILLRSLLTGEQKAVDNTAGASFLFWSPDSKFLGFFQVGHMRKVHLESGAIQNLTDDVKGFSRGASWSSGGKILYSPGSNDGLKLLDLTDGSTRAVTVLDTAMVDGSHRWPKFLPDGERFLYTVWSNVLEERNERGGVYLGSLGRGPDRRILRDVSEVVYVPGGYLLFHRNGRLMAVPFDPESGEVSDQPILVSRSVGFSATNGQIGVSADDRGDLFIGTHRPENKMKLAWVDRDDRIQDSLEVRTAMIMGLNMSRDSRHYAAEFLDDVGSVQIWIGDLERGSLSRLSRFDSDCWGPVFSPDGLETAYSVQTGTGGTIFRQNISGALDAIPVFEYDQSGFFTPSQWFAPDRVFIFGRNGQNKAMSILALDLETKTATPVLENDFDQFFPALSPDRRWLAYVSTESGTPEIYVRNWPGLDGKWQVSRDGGIRPHWSSDGAELAYLSRSNRLIMAVDFGVEDGAPRIGLPQTITELPPQVAEFAFSGDHARYLTALGQQAKNLPPIKVLVGWVAHQER